MSAPDRLYLRTETRAVLCGGGLALEHAPGELRPVGPMAGHVASVSFGREVFACEVVERVLPEGAVVLCFDAGDGPPRAVVSGATTVAATLRFRGVLEHVGVRLRAGGIAAVLGVPARELEGAVVPLEDLWGREGSALGERVAEVPLGERAALVLDAIRARLAARDAERDRAASRAVQAITAARGAVRVREVAASVGIGERRLEQIFARDVGLSPRRFARIARFRSAVDHATASPARRWSEIARACGYSDHAHLVREVRAITGHTPGELARFGFFQSPASAPR